MNYSRSLGRVYSKRVFIFGSLCTSMCTLAFAQAVSQSSVMTFGDDIKAALAAPKASITTPETVTAWDAFGMNTVVQGTLSQTAISKAVGEDVLGNVQRELAYDKKEESYLNTTETSPEEVQSLEQGDGSDVPDNAAFHPHPSFESNQEVSVSATEDSMNNDDNQDNQNNQDNATSSSDQTTATSPTAPTNSTNTDTENSTNTDTAVTNTSTATSTSTETTSTQSSETSSTPSTLSPTDTEVFNAILEGEQESPLPPTE